MYICRNIALSLSFGVLCSCASTSIQSNKAADYKGNPKRIYLLVNDPSASQFGESFRQVKAGLLQLAESCGAQLDVGEVTPLALDDQEYMRQASSFGADSVMVVKLAGRTQDQYGQILEVTYDVRLFDVQTDKTVWRASAKLMTGGWLTSGTKKGESLSAAIADRMRQDGLLQNCLDTVAQSTI